MLIRTNRRQTSAELRLVEMHARITSALLLMLAGFTAFVGYKQSGLDGFTARDGLFCSVVVAAFLLGALIAFAFSRLARKLRLNPDLRPHSRGPE